MNKHDPEPREGRAEGSLPFPIAKKEKSTLFYLIPGERLTKFAMPAGEPEENEIALRIDSTHPREDWRLTDQDSQFGYEDIGKRAVIEYAGEFFILTAASQPRDDQWQYDFRRLLKSDLLISAQVYPDDFLEAMRNERENKRSGSVWHVALRRSLIPVAGSLPRRAREKFSVWTKIDFDGASTPAAIILGFVTINWVILKFIIGAFAGHAFHWDSPYSNPLDLMMLALFVDTIFRIAFIVSDQDDERGILMLEFLECRLIDYFGSKTENAKK